VEAHTITATSAAGLHIVPEPAPGEGGAEEHLS
jgi:hypothetical protein